MLVMIEYLIILVDIIGVLWLALSQLKTGKGITIEDGIYLIGFAGASLIPLLNLFVLWFLLKCVIDDYGHKVLFKSK